MQLHDVHLAYKLVDPENAKWYKHKTGSSKTDSGVGLERYMINRTKLTISNVIAMRNPTKMNATPVASPLKRRDINPKRHRRIVLPATHREYPLTRSCEREVLSTES